MIKWIGFDVLGNGIFWKIEEGMIVIISSLPIDDIISSVDLSIVFL